jgi:hypothetical protein
LEEDENDVNDNDDYDKLKYIDVDALPTNDDGDVRMESS